MKRISKLGLSIIVSAAISPTAFCGADAFRPSPEQQVKLGKRVADALRKQEHVLPASDPRVKTLRRVARRILATFDERDAVWEYSFDVIDSKEVNAFALPGGSTFFFTGLLDRIKTEDELAGVLGHELTHVRKQHWAYAYADSERRNLGLTVLLMAVRANSNIANLAGLTNEVVFDLPFSRKHETEADDGGFDASIAAGYNPEGLADTFEMLRQVVKDGAPPEFFSDHPDDKNRIKRIEDKISASGRNFPAQVPIDY
ncbi:MAG: M48 family metalloprotease [Fimbriimonas sp.]|nr:M48 family metalloprotease [Fimbriimonas sp.]